MVSAPYELYQTLKRFALLKGAVHLLVSEARVAQTGVEFNIRRVFGIWCTARARLFWAVGLV